MDGSISSDDRDLLTRIALGESSGDPDERAGVVATVLNRVGQPGYPDSIKKVIFQRNQFTATQNKKGGFYRYSAPDYADARNIVDGVVSGSIADPTNGAQNFHAANMDPAPKWAQGQTPQQIGKTKFYGGKQASADDDRAFLSQFEQATPPQKANAAGDDRAFLSQFEQQKAPEQAQTPNARVAGGFEQIPAPAMEKPLNEVGPSSETLLKLIGTLYGGAGAFGAAKALPGLITTALPKAAKAVGFGALATAGAAAANEVLGPEAGSRLTDLVHKIRAYMPETP